MILDEIYEGIRLMRLGDDPCPFPDDSLDLGGRCDWCLLIFPEVYKRQYEGDWCPCDVIGYDYVKSEMRRLFP